MKRKLMSFSMPLKVYEKLKRQSEKELISMTALLVQIIIKYINNENGNKK